MVSKKIDITSAGAPIFDDSKAQKKMSTQIDAQIANSTSSNEFTKMKSSMDQVTPGKWKSKDCIDGKMP